MAEYSVTFRTDRLPEGETAEIAFAGVIANGETKVFDLSDEQAQALQNSSEFTITSVGTTPKATQAAVPPAVPEADTEGGE